MAYLRDVKTKSTESDTWSDYSNNGDYKYMLFKELELHLRDLNNQIKELTFENIKLRNIYGK